MTGIRELKLSERDQKINDFISKYKIEYDEIGTELKEKIIHSKAHEIYMNICENKTFTSRIVLLVFCFASIEAHQKTNCLTEIMFNEAFLISNNLDQFLEKSGRPIGPLHGIPFSIKDTFDIEGFGNFILHMYNTI